MRKYTPQQLQEFARKLKAKQDELEPCLTYEQMRKALGYKYDYSITKIARRLVAAGLAYEVMYAEGEKMRYRFMEPK